MRGPAHGSVACQVGVAFQKKPDEGRMKGLAFIKDPDGEATQAHSRLAVCVAHPTLLPFVARGSPRFAV
jgi:hypothetical protein